MSLRINTQKELLKVLQFSDIQKCFTFTTGAVSRHYESRCREYLDAQPNREAAKELNIKNTKIRSRKRQVCQP